MSVYFNRSSSPYDYFLSLYPLNNDNVLSTPSSSIVSSSIFSSAFSYYSESSSESSDSESLVSTEVSDSDSYTSDSSDSTSTPSTRVAEKENSPLLVYKERVKDFTLGVLKKKSVIEETDSTKFAEDFRPLKFSCQSIGYRHVWKRLNFFLTMSRYISERAIYLKEESIPFYCRKHQFKAAKYVVPLSYSQESYHVPGYTRAHISLLNKIVYERGDDGLVQMQGKLTVCKKKTSLDEFFNLCDIVPNLVNSIDWYAEFFLREHACKILSLVKDQQVHYTKAAQALGGEYRICLQQLKDKIVKKIPIKITKSCTKNLKECFDSEVSIILKNAEKAQVYINGMLNAADHFIDRFNVNKVYALNLALYD